MSNKGVSQTFLKDVYSDTTTLENWLVFTYKIKHMYPMTLRYLKRERICHQNDLYKNVTIIVYIIKN